MHLYSNLYLDRVTPTVVGTKLLIRWYGVTLSKFGKVVQSVVETLEQPANSTYLRQPDLSLGQFQRALKTHLFLAA